MQLFLIGIGTGNPDYLTQQAAHAIKMADLILIPYKGIEKSDLADLRLGVVHAIRPDAPIEFLDVPYLAAVNDWHGQIAERWAHAMAKHPHAHHVALLVWGDPSLYDSTLRIAARLTPQPDMKVIPGITAMQALTAAHAIPLNTINDPVLLTTGRQLQKRGWPDGATRVVVMLDGACAFQHLDQKGMFIWWGAYLGMADEILDAGPLAQVGARIIARRAAARTRKGWIMDTYLLARD